MARHRPLAVSAVAAAATNLALSIVLLPRLGVAGVALGTLIPAVVSSIGFVLPYAMRAVGASVPELLRQVVAPVLLPALPMVALTVALLSALRPDSFLALFAVAAAAMLVYGGAYLWWGTSQFERRAYGSLLGDCLRLIGRGFGPGE
jgi:O-antigen/teichoic acid export membrane protein